jgi:polyferredoxin
MTWLVWVGLLSFVGSTIALGILAGPVNRSQATLLIGWQNRLMILTYSLWPIIAAWPVVISKNRDL